MLYETISKLVFGLSKRELIHLAYGVEFPENVDSALPKSFTDAMSEYFNFNSSFWVMDYNDSILGMPVNLLEKLFNRLQTLGVDDFKELQEKLNSTFERNTPRDPYNGWTNYETWLCYTWLTNDQGTFIKASACPTVEILKEYTERKVTKGYNANLREDLVYTAFSNINFDEIFEAFQDGSAEETHKSMECDKNKSLLWNFWVNVLGRDEESMLTDDYYNTWKHRFNDGIETVFCYADTHTRKKLFILLEKYYS